MSDTFDELRIIATEANGLPQADRAIIAQAAEEYENLQRTLIATSAALIESQARQIAMNDRLIEIKRREVLPFSLSLYYGAPEGLPKL